MDCRALLNLNSISIQLPFKVIISSLEMLKPYVQSLSHALILFPSLPIGQSLLSPILENGPTIYLSSDLSQLPRLLCFFSHCNSHSFHYYSLSSFPVCPFHPLPIATATDQVRTIVQLERYKCPNWPPLLFYNLFPILNEESSFKNNSVLVTLLI